MKHATGTRWSEDEDAELKSLAAKGYSASQIGRKMKRSRNSVIGRIHRISAPRTEGVALHTRRWSPEQLQAASAMRAAGMAAGAIAEKFGTTRDAVDALFKRYKVSAPIRTKVSAPKLLSAALVEHPVMPSYTQPRDWPPLTLVERGQRCAYPVSGHGADTLFCGGVTDEGQTYCPACRRVMYTAPKTDAQRKDAARGYLRAAWL
jgi:hypothetical protein